MCKEVFTNTHLDKFKEIVKKKDFKSSIDNHINEKEFKLNL